MRTETIFGFITVRVSSHRLPAKCLLPFGEGNVIEHIVRRTRSFGIEPIICTSVESSDDVIEDIACKDGVKYFRGSLQNKLKRWSDCASHFGLESFHTIDADDPFFDGDEIKSSMRLLDESNFNMILPTEYSSAGGASVGYSLSSELVKRASNAIPADCDSEMFWYYLENIDNVRSKALPADSVKPMKVRLTLDYYEDYWLLESVRRIVGNLASRKDINQLFRANPDLYKINWFRNEEWKQAQIMKVPKLSIEGVSKS